MDRVLPPLQTCPGGDCLHPREATSYLTRFSEFSSSYATEMKKQYILEARLPKEMREGIEAENAHRALLWELLNG